MPNKITYTITTSDGKSHQVSRENIDRYGWNAYADAYKGATVRMRDKDRADYDIPIEHYDDAVGQGLHAFTFEHTVSPPQPKAAQQPAATKPTAARQEAARQVKGTPAAGADGAGLKPSVQSAKGTPGDGRRSVFVPEMENVVMATPSEESLRRYPWLSRGEVSAWNRDTGEPLYTYTDGEGRHMSVREAAAQDARADIEGDESLRPRKQGAVLELPGMGISALNLKGSGLSAYVDGLMRARYGDDYMTAARKGGGGSPADMSALADETRQRIADELTADIRQTARKMLAKDGAERDALMSSLARKWQGGISPVWLRSALSKEEDAAGKEYDPGWLEALGKGVAAGFTRAGAGLVDALQQLSSGMYYEDPSSPAGFSRTRGYDEAMRDADAPLTAASGSMHGTAERLSREAQPRYGRRGFLDMLWSGDISGALKKGLATAGESLPMTLSAYNPYTMTLNAISMAGGNYRDETLENPDVPEWKRAANAIGQAVIEQAVEKFSDPVFKYAGGALGGRTARAAATEVTQEAAKTLTERIYGGMKSLLRDAAGEGAEEVAGNFGNDALGEALDALSGRKDYGWRAQWEEMRRENPGADLTDFASEKAKESIEAFIGGAMAGAYTAGSAQLSAGGLRYGLEKFGGSGGISPKGVIDPVLAEVSRSYDGGYSADDAQKSLIKARYEHAERQMRGLLGVGGDADMDAATGGRSPVRVLQDMQAAGRGEDDMQKALDYYDARAAYDGMIQGARDRMEAAVAESDATVESRVNGADGRIHPATMRQDGRRVYIIDDNAGMTDDGAAVDRSKSDGSIIIRDAETGRTEFADPKDVLSVDEPLDAEQEKRAAAEAIRQEYAQREGDVIDGVLQFNPGDQYSIVDGQGQPHTVEVTGVGVDGQGQPADGAVSVNIDGQPAVLSKEQLQQMSDAETVARLNASLQRRAAARREEAAQEQAGAQAAATLPFALNDEVTLQLPDGQTTRGSITAEQNEDGLVEVYTEEKNPEDGSRVHLYTPEELRGMVTEYNGEAVGLRKPNESGGLNGPGDSVMDLQDDAKEGEFPYTLSESFSDNGERFYQDASGNIDLVTIPQSVFEAIGKKSAPFRLIPSMLRHVYDRHGKEMALTDPQDAILFVLDVMDNFDHVRQGDGGALVFSVENGRNRTGRRAVSVLLDSKSGDYYGIKTSGYERMNGLQKRPLLWEKGANETSATGVAPANVPTAKAQQGNGQSGSASNQGNGLYAGKDSESSVNPQENAGNIEPMPMVKDKDGVDTDEPDFQAASPSRAHAYIYNEAELSRGEADGFVNANVDAARKALDRLRRKEPKMGTSISAYKAAKAALADELAAARRRVDYWNAVKAEQAKVIAAERAAQAERDASLHDAAVIEEQQRKEAEAKAAAERAEVGNENPMPQITEKWNAAPKVYGAKDEVVLANGDRVAGHYVLTESGAATPSHQSTLDFQKSEGFPMDENGNTVNDRDYERDKEAQGFTRVIAAQYDSRALQSPVVVSRDGVVLSGNGRTMAGELAARDNTDAAYNEYLRQYAQKYGFTPGQVGQMQHPRVVFVPDERMPYTAGTFSKFNQNDMKSQSKTEQSVKLGKIVDDATFNRIVRMINAFDTLGDFYNDAKAANEAVKELQAAGVITPQQMAEMYDGDGISAVGREMLENTLIGKAFEGSPDAVRMITEFKGMRQSVITALSEIANNVGLGKEFSLEDELSEAVELCYNARHNGYKYGENVSDFARQTVLFGEEGETIADYQNATIMMLADLLNDQRTTQLKKALAVYNSEAHDSANGQTDMFSGGVKSKEDILKDVLKLLNHGTNEQQQSAINNAVEQRKAEADSVAGATPGGIRTSTGRLGSSLIGTGVQQNGVVEQGNQGGGESNAQRGRYSVSDIDSGRGGRFYQDENGNINLVDIPQKIFDKINVSPLPFRLTTSMAKHVYEQHSEELGLDSIEDAVEFVVDVMRNVDHVREGDDGSFIFSVENGRMRIGKRTIAIVVNAQNGDFLGIKTSGYDRLKSLQKRSILWEKGANETSATDAASANVTSEPASQGGEPVGSASNQSNDLLNSVLDNTTDTGETLSGNGNDTATPENTVVSAGKDTESSAPGQGNAGISSDNQLSSPENEEKPTTAEAVAQAEQEVDTNPTEAQKAAGNYRKGHVTIGDFDITIEQPKGSVRRGVDANGKKWETEMQNTYGYIRGTEGVDGDHIDVFLADNMDGWDGRKVFVVDQTNTDGSFDEHKCMLGFNSIEEAENAYYANYSADWKQTHPNIRITGVSIEDFNKWIQSSHRKTKPFSEYRVAREGDATPPDGDGNPRLLAERLAAAYASGSVRDTERAENSIRACIEGVGDYKGVFVTFLRSRDYTRWYKYKKDDVKRKVHEFIASVCKDVIKGAGINPGVLYMARARMELAGKTDDALTLDVLSADEEPAVVGAVIRNPHTADGTLERLKEAYSNYGPDVALYGLDKAVDQALRKRRKSGTEGGELSGDGLVKAARSPATTISNTERQSQEQATNPTEPPQQDNGIRYREDDGLTEEERGIVVRAKADGSYMKAPNGKATRLTEKQWAQVRTRAFKDWFGDWEKAARVEKLRKSKPVKITGREIEASDDLKQYKKNARDYGKKLQGEYTNKDTGQKVYLQRGRRNGGINEVLQHDYKDIEHLQSIAAIPQIIESSIYIDSSDNLDKGKNPDVKEYQYYVCGLKIGDADYTVRSTIAVDKNGNRYYDHKLTTIEKGKLLDRINGQAVDDVGFGTTPGTTPTTDKSAGKDTKLVSILQVNSSKVVDENGEPLVVYHGTLAKDLHKFDKDFVGSRYSYDEKGFFFISNETIAKDYSISEFDSGRKGMVVPAYISLSNPLIVDSQWCRNNGLGGNVFKDNDVIEFWDNYQSLMIEESENNDGVVITDGKDTMVVAFDAIQIKSATDNRGTFSSHDADIRYREDGEEAAMSKELGLDESLVRQYADAMRKKNLSGATRAEKEMRRKLLLEGGYKSLGAFVKAWKPVETVLKERFGDVEVLRQEYVERKLTELGVMEAARKKAEEAAERERKRQSEFEMMDTDTLDSEYMKALEKGDESRMRDLVNEAARRNGYAANSDIYQGAGAWVAPSDPGYTTAAERRTAMQEDNVDVNVTDIADGVSPQPDDIFSNLRAYGNDTPEGRESVAAIGKAIEAVKAGRKATVKVYRAVPSDIKEGSIRNGDWVSPSRKYAEMHGMNRLQGKYRIMEQEVPADELWWDGNDVNEWGYDDGRNYVYRNVKNNRKLFDLVTRDDKGNVIPLSKRFNPRKKDARFRLGDPAETFGERQRAAVENKGTVMPGLNEARVEVVPADPNSFKNFAEAKQWAKEHIERTYDNKETGGKGEIHISHTAVGKFLSESAVKKSTDKEVHLAVLKVLPEVIRTSVEAEEHPDYGKDKNNRSATNDINPNVLMHRLYGDVKISDKNYRVKITLKEDKTNNYPSKAYSYEATKIELLAGLNEEAVTSSRYSNNSISVAKLLQGVEKSYDKGKKLLDESEDLTLGGLNRAADGAISDDSLSYGNDPRAKVQGGSYRTARAGKVFAARERKRMRDKVTELAEKLHISDDVRIVEDVNELEDARDRRAKGFYDLKTGKITIVIPNHVSMTDAVQTLLHEGVAHYGLRKLFGENFDNFLDNVFNNAEESIRQQIVEMSKRHGWDFRTATEEYLAGLAEDTEFENINASWWHKIRDFFMKMLNKIGISGAHFEEAISDGELRYILWRSYENMKNPGRYRNVFAQAEDVAVQNRLKAGNYAEREAMRGDRAAEPSTDIEEVNRRFNERLLKLTKGATGSRRLSLGRAGGILRAAGVADAEVVLDYDKVVRKGADDYKNAHPFNSEELNDLPQAINAPLAVFESASDNGDMVILTEMQKDGKNFIVAVRAKKEPRRGGKVLEINEITTLYPKEKKGVVNWILNGKGKYYDKEKALNWLGLSQPHADSHSNQELVSAANVVRNFENPSVGGGKSSDGGRLYRSTGDPEERDRVYVRNEYEKAIASNLYQFQEAVQDSMLGLKTLMDKILKAGGRKEAADFENAYMAENALSSKNRAEADAYKSLVMKPLLDAVAELEREGASREEITDYMMAKHGLERNRVMAQRDYEAYLRAFPQGTKTLSDFLERDYAGLTALTQEPDVTFAAAAAQRMVDDFESGHDTKALWEKTNAATKATLSKIYESGLLSRERYEYIRDMYDNYIPLRGWDDTTSDEVYGYLTSKDGAMLCGEWWNAINAATKSSLKKRYDSGLMSKAAYEHVRDMFQYYIPLKGWDSNVAADEYEYKSDSRRQTGSPKMITAKGRSSLADDPVATIAVDGMKTIQQGNRNVMKHLTDPVVNEYCAILIRQFTDRLNRVGCSLWSVGEVYSSSKWRAKKSASVIMPARSLTR